MITTIIIMVLVASFILGLAYALTDFNDKPLSKKDIDSFRAKYGYKLNA